MKTIFKLTVVVSIAIAATGCRAGTLSAPDAQAILDAHTMLAKLKPIRVEAVSQADGGTEAIVRTVIADAAYSLKFRRYDNGWRWEFAETVTGGWIAPDAMVGQLLETRRSKRAQEWAREHRQKYEWTFKALNGYSNDLPRRPAMELRSGWDAGRAWSVRAISGSPRTETEKVQALFESNGSDRDAWDRQILAEFLDATRSAVFTSLGVDGQKGTPDDIVVLAYGLKEWDADYRTILWNYYKSWTVPEGLDDAVKSFVSSGGKGELKTTRIVADQ